jgi:hypothetical protein
MATSFLNDLDGTKAYGDASLTVRRAVFTTSRMIEAVAPAASPKGGRGDTVMNHSVLDGRTSMRGSIDRSVHPDRSVATRIYTGGPRRPSAS